MKMKKLIVAALLGIITTTKAMTITDNLIVWECPYCGAKASERELGSWNTFVNWGPDGSDLIATADYHSRHLIS